MDSELLLKFIGLFPDLLSALSRTLLRFFGQPLSKQLYTYSTVCRARMSCVMINARSIDFDSIGKRQKSSRYFNCKHQQM